MAVDRAVALLLFACIPLASHAGEYSARATGAPGAVETLTVTFAGDGATVETEVTLDFNNQYVSISNPVAEQDAICRVVSATRLRIVPPSGGVTPLTTTETVYCTFSVAISASAPLALVPLNGVAIECSDATAAFLECTLAADSGVNVAGAPAPRGLSYMPSVGSTITFPAGAFAGDAAPARLVSVAATGNTGPANVSNCAITGAGAASFSLTPTALDLATSTPQSLSIGCTYPTIAAAATLSCVEIDGDTPAPGETRQFNLSCPAAPNAPDIEPLIGSVPFSGSTIVTAPVPVGNVGTALIDLTASGGSGAASVQINCVSSGNVWLAAAPGSPIGQGPVIQTVTGSAQPIDLRVGVVQTSVAQSPAGAVSCTVSGQPNIVINVNSPLPGTIGPIISPPPPPSLPPLMPASPIPAATPGWLALVGLLVGLAGMLSVGFRRAG